MQNERKIKQQTLEWIKQVVIKEGFCPFAARSVENNSVEIKVFDGTSMSISGKTQEQVYINVISESARLCNAILQNQTLSNGVLVLPKGFNDFDDFLDLIYVVNSWLEESDSEQDIQLAHFHPDYYFEDAEIDDASNFTNRSPYPMLHFLQVAEVAKAIEHFKDIDDIPEINKQRAEQLGKEYFVALLNNLKAS